MPCIDQAQHPCVLRQGWEKNRKWDGTIASHEEGNSACSLNQAHPFPMTSHSCFKAHPPRLHPGQWLLVLIVKLMELKEAQERGKVYLCMGL